MVDLADVTLTQALAVWGAITGSVAVFNAFRERPRLELITYTQMFGHDRELILTAVNRGRRPAVVVHAGIATDVEIVRIGRFRRRLPRIGAERGQPPADVLPPGHVGAVGRAALVVQVRRAATAATVDRLRGRRTGAPDVGDAPPTEGQSRCRASSAFVPAD